MLWMSNITTVVLGCPHRAAERQGCGCSRQARRPFYLLEPRMCHGRDQQEPVDPPCSLILYSADRDRESAMLPTSADI